MGQPLLRVDPLSTSFATENGSVRAVDDVSISLEAAETRGLVGEAGGGQRVTALSVMGLLDPAGRIEPGSSIVFDGRELVGLDAVELRRMRGNELTMIFQDPTR